MRFSSTSFCSIICVAVQIFLACGGRADASTPRGSASCADPRGVLLLYLKAPLCKELFVRRRKRSLQLHVHAMLLPVPHTAQASCAATVHCAAVACCCWHRELRWRLEKANLEIFILQGSSYFLCKALVQCHRTPSVVCVFTSCHRLKFGRSPESHYCSLESTKNQGKTGI